MTRHCANNRKYIEVIVFVHHFGGSPSSLDRHIQVVNELGFDCVSFQLPYNDISKWFQLPIASNMKIGFRHVWIDKIESVMNSIAERKIAFSFSLPSASLAAALANRNCSDIAAWITDGGPYLQIKRCIWNYTKHIMKIQNPVLRAATTLVGYKTYGGNKYEIELARALNKFPERFPVLSICSWQDKIVPASAIEDAFRNHRQIALETLVIPEADHLCGLKDAPDDYIPRVSRFLKRFATKID